MAPTTIFTLPTSTLPPGVFTSQSFVMPSGFAVITIAFTVSQPDIADPTKSMTYEMDRQDPNNSTHWLFDNGFTWIGNTINSRTGLPDSPIIGVDIGPLAGQTCRIVLNLPTGLNTAILVTGQ